MNEMLPKKLRKKDERLFEEVRKLQQGQPGSFDLMYNLSKNYFYKIIYDNVRNHHTTEDLLQETYIRILNNIGTLKEPDAFYVWAGRIATNLCWRYLQKNRHEVLPLADENGYIDFHFERASEDGEGIIPEDILMNREKQRMIDDIVNRLSVPQRICVQFFYFEEMSVNEIAEVMDCSAGTVKSRLSYARKTLKDAVETTEKREDIRLHSLSVMPVFYLSSRIMAEKITLATVGVTAATGSAKITAKAKAIFSTGFETVKEFFAKIFDTITGMVSKGTANGTTTLKATGNAASSSDSATIKGFFARFFGTTTGKVATGVTAAALLGTGVAVVATRTPSAEEVVVQDERSAIVGGAPEEEPPVEEEIDDSLVQFEDASVLIRYSFSGLPRNYPDYPNPKDSYCLVTFDLPYSFDQETAGLVKKHPGTLVDEVTGYAVVPEQLEAFMKRTFPAGAASDFFVAHEQEAAQSVTLEYYFGHDQANAPYRENIMQNLSESFSFEHDGVTYVFHITEAVAYIDCALYTEENVEKIPENLEWARGQVVHYDRLETEIEEYAEFGNEDWVAYANDVTYLLIGYATCDKQELLAANNLTKETIEEGISLREEREENLKKGFFVSFYAPPGGFAYVTGAEEESSGTSRDEHSVTFWHNSFSPGEFTGEHPDLTYTYEDSKGKEQTGFLGDEGWAYVEHYVSRLSDAHFDEYPYGEGYYVVYHTGLKQFVNIEYFVSQEDRMVHSYTLYNLLQELQ